LTSVLPPQRRTRPANRRDLIVVAAKELFAARGFEYVNMSEIAEAVAVRPSALYRHFSSKEHLLQEILRLGLASLGSAVSSLDLSAGPDGLLELAGLVVDNRSTAGLLGREVPHLSEGPRASVRSELVAVAHLLAAKIGSERPQLHPHAGDFLSWAALAVLQSPAYQHAELPRADHASEVAQLTWQVISSPLPDQFTGSQISPNVPGLLPFSRREALLARAVDLFAARTYASVSIEDVAATLGIAGPSVYNHFPSKSAILVTALFRGSAWLSMQVADTLAKSENSEAALASIIRSYAEFAAAHPALTDLMISEVRSLPEPDREVMLTAQRDYVGELAQLLRQVHPALSLARANVQVQAALMIANDVARSPHLRDQSASTQAVTALCGQILGLAQIS
jgi:AcrR family transcriptional regulator